MIVRKLRVEGWQCFADPIEIGPFGNGLNIVHGPNGIGKSTLFRALVRGLCDTHRTKGKDMELLRPWGRDLTPAVTIDFDHNDVSYRLRKQFLQSNAAEVQRSENGRLVRLHEGQKADDFVRQLLFVEGPKTGATKGAEHWGIAQVLWSQQGELKLDTLSNPVRSSLQQALGAQVTTAATDQTTQRIAQQYNAWFTSTGRLKSGGDAAPAVALELQLKAAQEHLRKLRLSLNEYDDAVHRIENLRLTAEQKRHASKQLEELHSAAILKSTEYTKLVHERDARQKDTETAKAQFDQLDAQLKAIQAARKELTEFRQQIATIASDLPAIQKDLEQCNETWERARQARDTIVRQRDVVDQSRQQAQQALQFEQLHKSHAALTDKLTQLQALQIAIDRLQTQVSSTVAPDAKTLKAIQTAL
ncbi:MAG TPA: AAA family ATPase, partial [Pirellulaceae bacterium]|nr:AAA family ATPase [Pirellulaceae bacterium]